MGMQMQKDTHLLSLFFLKTSSQFSYFSFALSILREHPISRQVAGVASTFVLTSFPSFAKHCH